MSWRAVLTVTCLVSSTSGAFAELDDTSLESMLATYSEKREVLLADPPENMVEALRDAANHSLAGADFTTLDAEQLAELSDENVTGYVSRDRVQEMLMRLVEISRDQNASRQDRALAACVGATLDLVGMYRGEYPVPAWASVLQEVMQRDFLDSPERIGVLRGEHGSIGMQAMLLPDPDGVLPSSRISTIIDAMGDEYPVESVNGPNTLWDYAGRLADREADPLAQDERERARLFCLSWTQASAAHYQAKIDDGLGSESDQRIVEFLTSSMRALDSLAARGLLIGHLAPELSIQWSSDPGLSSLADLKGKVVVLDFFATWCGPCIETFPIVRGLRERYPEDQVAIVMITSPQGAVYNLENSPIDCAGDEEKEIALMPPFMDRHAVTWTVAMLGGEDEVFHPDFGVRGIPHVAIIDSQGRVRHNGLHPADPSKTDKIDELLIEAGFASR